jgi:hypothetical protein
LPKRLVHSGEATFDARERLIAHERRQDSREPFLMIERGAA